MNSIFRIGAVSVLVCLTVFAQSNSYIVEDPPKSAMEEQVSFTLPPGFEIQLVASEPDIHKPMQLAFDEKGRLLVTTSTDYPLGPKEGEAPSDKLMMIEVDGATGKAVSIKTVLDGLNIPSGVETLPGDRIILAHAPDVLLLHHKDGIVDSREVLYTGFAREDTHELPNSFTWGVDGWLYGLQGHVNKSDVRDTRGTVTPIHFGNTYRMKPDGSAIEVYAPGMSNPWGLTFDERYNLFATDCESRPLWQIDQGFAYQGFNQPKAPAGYAPNITEDPHGASGFAGLVYFDAQTFPPDFRHCLYLGNPILGRVHRDGLKGEGFTRFTDRKPDFVESSDRWFRPVDLELGPDGALYIADWYNSIISHVEVRLDHPGRDKARGRIWRVVYRGAEEERSDRHRRDEIDRALKGAMAADWSKASRRDLIAALARPESWIRRMASQQLMYRFPGTPGKSFVRIGQRTRADGVQRVEALWLACRRDALPSAAVKGLLADTNPLVRAQAARLLGVLSDDANEQGQSVQSARGALIALVNDIDPTVRFRAIMAAGRIPTEQSAGAVLHAEFGNYKDDPLLHHAALVSLSEHMMQTTTLLNADARALDDAGRTRLTKALAATQTRDAARALAHLASERLIPRDALVPAVENIVTNADSDSVKAVLQVDRFTDPGGVADVALYVSALLNAIRDKPDLTTALSPALERMALLLSGQGGAESERLAAEAGTLFKSEPLAPVAEKVMRDEAQEPRARRNAAIALMRLDFDRYAPKVAELLGGSDASVSARRALAEELAARCKTPEQVDALLVAIKTAPGDVKLGAVQRLLTQRPGVTLLFDAIDAGKLSPSYLTAPLFDIFVYWAHRDPAITARYDALVARAPSITDENEKTIAALGEKLASFKPDVARGRAVFEKNCMVCHRLAGQGAMRGPNLDGVGNRDTERLLQDIVTPSRDVDPAFRTIVVTTRDGVVMSGLLVRETANEVVIADAEGNETNFARGEIEETRREWISPMPSGFAQVLPEPDLLNVVAYLAAASIGRL